MLEGIGGGVPEDKMYARVTLNNTPALPPMECVA